MNRLPRCGVVGPGRLGKTLAVALHAQGCLLWLKGRSPTHASWAQAQQLPYTTSWDGLPPVEIVWLTVPDRELLHAATECFAALGDHLRGCSVVHCAGSLGADILRPIAPEAIELGAAHPFQTFPLPPNPDRFRCIGWLVESPWAQTRHRLTSLIRALGGIPVVFPTVAAQRRAFYHAAAILASNVMVALLQTATELIRTADMPDELFLRPLVESTVRNVFATLGILPLTGPITRGDWETLQRHLHSLPPELAETYRLFLLALGSAAYHRRVLSEESYLQLRHLLQPE